MKVKIKHKQDYDPISISDIEDSLKKNNLTIQPGMIVLIKTGRDKFNGTKDFHKIGTEMSAEATEWLIGKGIKVMGIDSWGWDLPLSYMLQKAKETENSELFWEAHLVGKNKEYCHMEQLVNLDELPYTGFKIAIFPLKIVGASAAPARVVALFD